MSLPTAFYTSPTKSVEILPTIEPEKLTDRDALVDFKPTSLGQLRKNVFSLQATINQVLTKELDLERDLTKSIKK